jgi:hypothetical protein
LFYLNLTWLNWTTDALQQSWDVDSSCIFVHGNFDVKDIEEMQNKADGMAVGSLCISVAVKLVSEDKWGLLGSEKVMTSYGSIDAYILEKLV